MASKNTSVALVDEAAEGVMFSNPLLAKNELGNYDHKFLSSRRNPKRGNDSDTDSGFSDLEEGESIFSGDVYDEDNRLTRNGNLISCVRFLLIVALLLCVGGGVGVGIGCLDRVDGDGSAPAGDIVIGGENDNGATSGGPKPAGATAVGEITTTRENVGDSGVTAPLTTQAKRSNACITVGGVVIYFCCSGGSVIGIFFCCQKCGGNSNESEQQNQRGQNDAAEAETPLAEARELELRTPEGIRERELAQMAASYAARYAATDAALDRLRADAEAEAKETAAKAKEEVKERELAEKEEAVRAATHVARAEFATRELELRKAEEKEKEKTARAKRARVAASAAAVAKNKARRAVADAARAEKKEEAVRAAAADVARAEKASNGIDWEEEEKLVMAQRAYWLAAGDAA